MEQQEYRAGRKNLLIALIASIPGPVALALSLGGGFSVTQLADLLRRSCELLSVVLAFVVFEVSHRASSHSQGRLEALVRWVTGLSMVFSGLVVGWLAITSFGAERGGVTTSLVLAILGALVNAKLYLGYRKLRHGVLTIQARLHRAKLLLDMWMTLVLLCTLASAPTVRQYADLIGSASIGLYVAISGLRLLLQKEGWK